MGDDSSVEEWRALLVKAVGPEAVAQLPVDAMLFLAEKWLDSEATLRGKREHRTFMRNTGDYGMDYFDAKDSYDGALEAQGDIERVIRNYATRGMSEFSREFASWQAARSK